MRFLSKLRIVYLLAILVAGVMVSRYFWGERLSFRACAANAASTQTADQSGGGSPVSLIFPQTPDGAVEISASTVDRLDEIGSLLLPGLETHIIAYSGDGERLAVSMHRSGSVYGTYLLSSSDDRRSIDLQTRDFAYGLAFGSNRLLARSFADEIEIWQLEPEVRLRCQTQGADNMIDEVAFSRDGELLVVAGTDAGVRVVRMADGKVVFAPRLKRSAWDIAITPDGKYLATLGPEPIYTLWDVEAKRKLWDAEFIYATKLAFSQDQRALAIGSSPIRIVDVATGAILLEVSDHHDPFVWRIVFSKKDDLLMASTKGRLFFWRVADGRLLRQLSFDHPVSDFGMSPDGKVLAVGFSDHNELRFFSVQAPD